MYRTVSDVYVSMINPGSRLDCTLTTATLSVNVGGVHVMACCRELERSTMLAGQFWTEGGVTSGKNNNKAEFRSHLLSSVMSKNSL